MFLKSFPFYFQNIPFFDKKNLKETMSKKRLNFM